MRGRCPRCGRSQRSTTSAGGMRRYTWPNCDEDDDSARYGGNRAVVGERFNTGAREVQATLRNQKTSGGVPCQDLARHHRTVLTDSPHGEISLPFAGEGSLSSSTNGRTERTTTAVETAQNDFFSRPQLPRLCGRRAGESQTVGRRSKTVSYGHRHHRHRHRHRHRYRYHYCTVSYSDTQLGFVYPVRIHRHRRGGSDV